MSLPAMLAASGVILLSIPRPLLGATEGPDFTLDALRWCGGLLVLMAPLLATAAKRGLRGHRRWSVAVGVFGALLAFTRDPLWLFPLLVVSLSGVIALGMAVMYDSYSRFALTVLDDPASKRKPGRP